MTVDPNRLPKIDFQYFFQYSLDLLIIAGGDGYFRRVNPAFCNRVGRTEEQILAEPFWNIIHPEDLAKVQDALLVLATGHPAFLVKVRLNLADGSYAKFDWTVYPDRESGLIYAIAHHHSDSVLALTRLKLLADFSPTAILLVDEDGRIEYTNLLAETVFAAPRNGLLGLPVEKLMPGRFRIAHEDYRNNYLAAPRLRPMGTVPNLMGLQRNGTEFPIDIGLNPVWSDGKKFIVCSVIDIGSQIQELQNLLDEREKLERDKARLMRLAEHDALTSLYNRLAFERILQDELELARDHRKTISLISLDIDNLKAYNDRFGHPAGDEMLKGIADIILLNVRRGDTVARLGGDEFIVCMPSADTEASMRLGKRLCAVIANHKDFQQMVTISAGASTFVFDGKRTAIKETGQHLIDEADKALYHSKKNGRNLFHHFNEIDTAGLE